MITIAIHLALTIVLMVLAGLSSLGGFALAFAVAWAALWGGAHVAGLPTRDFVRLWRGFRLAAFFFYELVISSIAVAWDVITPQDLSRPAILEVPLDVKSDTEILLVTNLISLTPGTLSLDVTPDRKTLLVHAMFVDDPEKQVRDLKNGMERMVREVFEA